MKVRDGGGGWEAAVGLGRVGEAVPEVDLLGQPLVLLAWVLIIRVCKKACSNTKGYKTHPQNRTLPEPAEPRMQASNARVGPWCGGLVLLHIFFKQEQVNKETRNQGTRRM